MSRMVTRFILAIIYLSSCMTCAIAQIYCNKKKKKKEKKKLSVLSGHQTLLGACECLENKLVWKCLDEMGQFLTPT